MGELPPPHPKPYSLARLPRGLGPGHLCPWHRSSRGVGFPTPPPAPPTSPCQPPGGSGNGGSAPPWPAGPQSRAFPPRRPRGAAAAAPLRPLLPPSLLPSFPPESGVRAGVGGDFARVSISYLAAKLSFCVLPSRSLQLLLSSEMPGQGKWPRAGRLGGGLGDGTSSGPGREQGAPAGRGRCSGRPLPCSLFMQSFRLGTGSGQGEGEARG